MTLTVKSSGAVTVTVPYWVSYKTGREFAISNKDWIIQKIKKVKDGRRKSLLDQGTKSDYSKEKNRARERVEAIIEKYNKHYNFKFKKIFIRNQKGRWGSCSEMGNLNFNYRIVRLSNAQAEYLVVHELCHLKEMNHSKRFWDLVSQTIPNHKKIAKELRGM